MTNDPLVVVHNRWGTYAGRTAVEILKAFHAQPASEGMRASFEQWIEHNRRLAKELDGVDLPAVFGTGINPERGCVALLKNMLEGGSLDIGPRPGDPDPNASTGDVQEDVSEPDGHTP